MIRVWAMWRRIEYAIGGLMLFSLFSVGGYFIFIYESPTCFDGMHNGEEHGMDCGGECARQCWNEVIPPKVLWAEAFKIVDGQYNLVAYIENANREIGTHSLPYTFTLSDAEGVIVERKGTTILSSGTYPIFEGRVMTGKRVPTEVSISLDKKEDVVWIPVPVGREKFSLGERALTGADDLPRLTAQMSSTLLEETKEVEIVATIFNSTGKPLTASRTVVENFPGRSTQTVVFTWPEPIATTLKSCELPSDVMLAIDLSGSMNNDGGTPPEPISSVLSAAKSFVESLREDDQVGVTTYATNAKTVSALTSDRARVAEQVGALSIEPEEERGSTNPGDALKRIGEEFATERHNPDANKVLILFTDGLANEPDPDPEGYALKAASELKAKGITLFTIGLGASLNRDFLRTMATDAQKAFIAPNKEDVEGIYTAISNSICKDGATVIEVIAKPSTSFDIK